MGGVFGKDFIPYYNFLMQVLDRNEKFEEMRTQTIERMAYFAEIMADDYRFPLDIVVKGVSRLTARNVRSAQNQYTAMVKNLYNLSDNDKQNLVNKVQELVGSSTIEALIRFIEPSIQIDLLKLLQFFAGKNGE